MRAVPIKKQLEGWGETAFAIFFLLVVGHDNFLITWVIGD